MSASGNWDEVDITHYIKSKSISPQWYICICVLITYIVYKERSIFNRRMITNNYSRDRIRKSMWQPLIQWFISWGSSVDTKPLEQDGIHRIITWSQSLFSQITYLLQSEKYICTVKATLSMWSNQYCQWWNNLTLYVSWFDVNIT